MYTNKRVIGSKKFSGERKTKFEDSSHDLLFELLDSQYISLERKSLAKPSFPTEPWLNDTTIISAKSVELKLNGIIEDENDCIQIDFANKCIGGGVFTYGCV
jgi:hypothetical protein